MLQKLYQELETEMHTCNIQCKLWNVGHMMSLKDTNWATTIPFGSYTGVLKALLLGIPLTVYVHEKYEEGYGTTFSVLRGAEIIESLRNYKNHYLSKAGGAESAPMHRKIVQSEIKVVIFRNSMSYDDALQAMKYISEET